MSTAGSRLLIELPWMPAEITGDPLAPLELLLSAGVDAAGESWLEGSAPLRLRSRRGSLCKISLVDSSETMRLLSVPVAAQGLIERVPAAPGVDLAPVQAGALSEFLQGSAISIDHIGINLCAADLPEANWAAALLALDAVFPTYLLQVGAANANANAIAIALLPSLALELVYDRGAIQSSFHVCVKVAATRAQVEARFPFPHGVYKPGDEAFFISLAPPPRLRIPTYLDLAFSDGQMAPWPTIVQAMGRRVSQK